VWIRRPPIRSVRKSVKRPVDRGGLRGRESIVSETVRLVADGEELVLSSGEQPRVQAPQDARQPALQRRDESAAEARIVIQYQGFHDADGRREYLLDARSGARARRYVVWIDLDAFSCREARFQDGPDISYQKLVRELAGTQLDGVERIAVTAGDLAAYRETHAPPVRRSFSPASPGGAAPKAAADGGGGTA
jgi:hypothetical protein